MCQIKSELLQVMYTTRLPSNHERGQQRKPQKPRIELPESLPANFL